jgi:uncharacterized SAM-binding protein YcdF (DUF218 family)
MVRRLVRSLLVLVTLVLVAGAITLLYIGWRINHTGSHDKAQQADAIVVLGARVDADGQPGPDLQERTAHAVRLFQRGLAPYLICTGGYRNDRLSAATVACDLAVALGVPAEKVLLADGSMTTREDALSARDLMLAQGWQTAILVSHPLHLERARLLFEAQGITVYPSPTNTDLAVIPLRTRMWLTAREVVGVLWVALEDLGVPYEWTVPLSRWVYGSALLSDSN